MAEISLISDRMDPLVNFVLEVLGTCCICFHLDITAVAWHLMDLMG